MVNVSEGETLTLTNFQMKLFTSIAAVAAVIGTSLMSPANASYTCSFNGRAESCTVYNDGGNYSVRWNSDGKRVMYKVYRGDVLIVEDNGRQSSGSSSYRNGYVVIYSSNGNATMIPNIPSHSGSKTFYP